MPDTLPHEPACIFCRIVSGTIPCHRLHEDAHVLAFLDVSPLSPGHCLIVPKGHWVTLDQLPDTVGGAVGALLPRLSRAMLRATGTTAFNVLQNNGRAAHQVVDHVHFHLIPKTPDERGLGIVWPAGQLDPDTGDALAREIRDGMSSRNA